MGEPAIRSPTALLHQSRTRLRFRYMPGIDGAALCARLDQLAGVKRVRLAASIRSLAVEHDGRTVTRDAVLQAMAQSTLAAGTAPATPRTSPPRRAVSPLPAVVAATIPAMPTIQ